MDEPTDHQRENSSYSSWPDTWHDLRIPGSGHGKIRLHGLERLGYIYVHLVAVLPLVIFKAACGIFAQAS